MVINCIKIANDILSDVKKDILSFKNKYNINPKIVIIRLNNDPSSEKYVNIKIRKAQELGVDVELITHLKNQDELILYLKKINADKKVHGYLIQLPLPEKFNKNEVFDHIIMEKDLDGLSSLATSRNFSNHHEFHPKPCVALAIMKIFAAKKYNLTGKHVVIVNRSSIIGKALVPMLLEQNATVTICHSKTKNLSQITNQADVLISAIGKPKFLKKQSVKKNALVIDAGTSVVDEKIVGDVDFDQVVNQARAITPVPNGVGRLTVAMIFSNLVALINQREKNEKI